MEIVAYLVNALLYGALAIYFWRTRWRVAAGAHASHAGASPAAEHYAVLVPLTLHALLLGRSLFAPDGLHLGLANAVSAILWLTVLIYWLGNFFYRLDGLQALVLPARSRGRAAARAHAAGARAAQHRARRVQDPSADRDARLQPVHDRVAARAADGAARAPAARRHASRRCCRSCRRSSPWKRCCFASSGRVSYCSRSRSRAASCFPKSSSAKPRRSITRPCSACCRGSFSPRCCRRRHLYGWRGRIAVRWTLAGFLTLVLAYIGSKFVRRSHPRPMTASAVLSVQC